LLNGGGADTIEAFEPDGSDALTKADFEELRTKKRGEGRKRILATSEPA